MTAYEHWAEAGHSRFRKICSVKDCPADAAWETHFNWFCAAQGPRHPFRRRTKPEFSVLEDDEADL
jgi:hypothetical protein